MAGPGNTTLAQNRPSGERRTCARTHGGGCARQEITGNTAVEPRKSPGDSGLLFFAPPYDCDSGAGDV